MGDVKISEESAVQLIKVLTTGLCKQLENQDKTIKDIESHHADKFIKLVEVTNKVVEKHQAEVNRLTEQNKAVMADHNEVVRQRDNALADNHKLFDANVKLEDKIKRIVDVMESIQDESIGLARDKLNQLMESVSKIVQE